ncbi:MAG: threonylcarbamoyl-AMP synthase [Chloroflexi bacterium]|nr:threonylcarbamoyl-AMP synthase [Chloroflexota bacterium]MCI0580109.1 threonylcarbamoyl-AMP synthase [Chloroflexota bacterium]MCI0649315.1 threonylcarbamoyl-AMP synthase [Chloroflexota bacterium]MCI0725952.1 threonylcarbamoyl-AMP synthase [Chloroflexota bacterium]
MDTRILDARQPGAIEEAARQLKRGQLVAFPTDTLYGVGADPFNGEAIDRLYQAKERPLEKGIPVLLADVADLEKMVKAVPAVARPLMARFWPGPLTLIMPRRADLPAALSPNEGIAVRIPDNAVARRFIRAAGGAVATSSANRAGEAPACDAHEALVALRGLVAVVLDGGLVHYGQASTILDCTCHPPQLLREGPIAAKNLPLVIGTS